ncbi:MAG: hypothetical protein K2K15_03725 [Anaeroplasmataceae bacterium]|nr:hypothetical protein [Anaeroplasmataceae bacterium]
MKLPNAITRILKLFEENGYEAYIVKEAVYCYLLGLDIEEYEMITSAPPFSLKKEELPKNLQIHYQMTKSSYYKTCDLTTMTILYKPHQIIDDFHALKDLEEKRLIPFSKEISLETLIMALYLGAKYDFSFHPFLEHEFIQPKAYSKNMHSGCILLKLIQEEKASLFFRKYQAFFSSFFPISSFGIEVFSYINASLELKLSGLCVDWNLLKVEEVFKSLGVSEPLSQEVQRTLSLLKISHIEALSEEDMTRWFILKRALALANKNIKDAMKLEQLAEVQKKKRRNEIKIEELAIDLVDLEEMGYTKQQGRIVLRELLIRVNQSEIPNTYEVLLAKAYQYKQWN